MQKLETRTQNDYNRSQWIIENDFDDDGIGTAMHWDTYFGVDKERFHAAANLGGLESIRDSRTFSRGALASSLLQYAKQGLSVVHGGPKQAPSGRIVAGLALKEVIWQARNHGIHWEEGRPTQQVIDCFENLKAVDVKFGSYRTENLSFEVVSLLGWRDWGTFEVDMLSLG